MPAQQHCDSYQFRYRRAAFYNGLKPESLSKVGLAAAKAAASGLRVNLNIDGCGVVAPLGFARSRPPRHPPPTLHAVAPRFVVRGGQTRT